MSKRGHDEGSVYQRTSDGRWVGAISLPNGKRKYVYGQTQREARDKLRMAQRDQENGLDLNAPSQTVGQFLDRWLQDVVKPNKAPKTHASYAEIVRLHAIPALGRHRLRQLGPQHVAALLKEKRDAGLSPRRVHHIRAVLRTALNQAMRWGLVTRNAAALVEPPRVATKEVRPFTPDEARALLAAVEADRLAALFRLALALGLRQGEVLGLRWEDVDLDAGALRVRQTVQRIDGSLIVKEPKTDKSRRTLRLPASIVAALRSHRVRQLEERLVAGARWQERGLVFTTGIGTPLDPRNVIRSWHRVQVQESSRRIEQGYRDAHGIPTGAALSEAQEAELAAILGDPDHPTHAAHALPRRPFHTTRHTAASLLLAEGVPLKVVQEVLGHSLLSTTADIYSHLAPAAFQEAADAMERALAG